MTAILNEKLTEEDKLNIFEILVRRFGDQADEIMTKFLLLANQ